MSPEELCKSTTMVDLHSSSSDVGQFSSDVGRWPMTHIACSNYTKRLIDYGPTLFITINPIKGPCNHGFQPRSWHGTHLLLQELELWRPLYSLSWHIDFDATPNQIYNVVENMVPHNTVRHNIHANLTRPIYERALSMQQNKRLEPCLWFGTVVSTSECRKLYWYHGAYIQSTGIWQPRYIPNTPNLDWGHEPSLHLWQWWRVTYAVIGSQMGPSPLFINDNFYVLFFLFSFSLSPFNWPARSVWSLSHAKQVTYAIRWWVGVQLAAIAGLSLWLVVVASSCGPHWEGAFKRFKAQQFYGRPLTSNSNYHHARPI